MAPEKRSPGLVILFSILTCGIYYYYWIYSVSNDVKTFLGDEEANPGLEVLFTILTCGLYLFYWYYKYNQKIMEMSDRAGLMRQDNYVIHVILMIFGLSIVSSAIIQSQLNNIWDNTYYRQA